MDRKRELKQQYKESKPEMGLIIVRSKANQKCLIIPSQNMKGMINRTKLQLDLGSHINRELQKDLKEFGQANFTIEVLETLAYDKDESKTDYTDDLALLKMIWEEKLAKENLEFYTK